MRPTENASIEPTLTRLLCVDDHAFVRAGLTTMINSQPDMKMLAQAATSEEALAAFRLHRPDVTLLDLRLADMSGIDVLISIRNEFPPAPVTILTAFEKELRSNVGRPSARSSTTSFISCNTPMTHRRSTEGGVFPSGGKKRGLIKGKKWLLMSRWKTLTQEHGGELNRLLQLNRRVFKAYMLKESLERLWNYRYRGPCSTT